MTVTATTAASTSSAAADAASSATSLTKLAGNFNDFLTLLTTQLKNQDPTSPMDTNQFTSQLVQFTSVAEQIGTNKTLGQILTANLAQQLTQASSLVGQKVTFTGGTLPLQNSSATVNYQTTAAESVQFAVSDAKGNVVHSESVNAAAGSSTWTWNGASDSGAALPDGPYTVAVTSSGTAVPFQAVGTVTGADQANSAVELKLGTTSVTYGDVVSLGAS